MTDLAMIDEFIGSWKFIRGMTHQFVETVPSEHWNFAPHSEFSPLSKQFRHMIWVTGLYAIKA